MMKANNLKFTRTKLNIYLSAFLVMLLGMDGCTSNRVATSMDRSVNFREYRTFGFMQSNNQAEHPVYKGELIDKNIKTAVKEEFEKRGMVYDPTDPDLLVGYSTYTEKRRETTGGFAYPYAPYGFHPYGFGWGMGFGGWGGWGYPYGGWANQPRTYTYTEGTLILDMVDNKTNELIWRGSIEGDVDNIGKLQKKIDKGVQAILKEYPVKSVDPLRRDVTAKQ